MRIPDGRGLATLAFTCLSLLIIVGPIINALRNDISGEGNPLRQVSYILVFCVLVVATYRWKYIRAAGTVSVPVNLLLLWCWLSVLWAIDPGTALRRLILTTLIIVSVFISVSYLGKDRTLRVIRSTFTLVLLLNILAVILFPGLGVHAFDPEGDPGLVGDWRGILPEKNLAGAITAVTFLFLFFQDKSKMNLVHFFLMALTVFFLIQTGSKTSIGIGCIALISGIFYSRYDHRNWPVAMILVSLLAISAVVAVLLGLDHVVRLLDTGYLFTGRTQIWSALISFVQNNWLLGAGYGSFWNIGTERPILTYARHDTWVSEIASGHNGFLDLTTQIGVPGLALAVFGLFIHPFARLLTDPRHRSGGPLLMALLVFCAGHNMTETSMFDRDHVLQFCLMWTIAAILLRPSFGKEPLPQAGDRGFKSLSGSDPKL